MSVFILFDGRLRYEAATAQVLVAVESEDDARAFDTTDMGDCVWAESNDAGDLTIREDLSRKDES